MRVLVTNSQACQAYCIIRGLRDHVDRIVATLDGTNWFRARTAHAANSRYVDARYTVPRPDLDWHAGRIQAENTEQEERYIKRIEEICQREGIDTIFPSYDPQVYVFAKNKDRFEGNGIVIVGPDYRQVLTPMDKYASVRAAEEAGLPVPKTFLPEDDSELDDIAAQMGPPWVVKPRFTAGSKGQVFVTDRSKLKSIYNEVSRSHRRPMIQEFIPGSGKMNFYVMADRDSELISFFAPVVLRTSKRLFRNSCAAALSSSESEYRPQVQTLLKSLQWWGGLTIQNKIDARDGRPKLMEFNPRLGSRLWLRTELGVNEPLTYVQLAQHESPELSTFPPDVLLLEPLDDLFGLPFELIDLMWYRLRTGLFRAEPTDPSNPPLPLIKMLKGYASNYMSGQRKVFSPHARYMFSDPLPCLLWYYAFMGYSLRSLKHLGK